MFRIFILFGASLHVCFESCSSFMQFEFCDLVDMMLTSEGAICALHEENTLSVGF